MTDLSIFRNGSTGPRAISTQEYGYNGTRDQTGSTKKNVVTTGNVTNPEKSQLDPPLAEGQMDDGATFFLYTHAPLTTRVP